MLSKTVHLAVLLALSAGLFGWSPVRAQCGSPNDPVPCRDDERKRRPTATDVPATATFTPTPEPTPTSTPAPTATGTPPPTTTDTPAPGVGLLPAIAGMGNAGNWLPVAGAGVIALAALGFLLMRGLLPSGSLARGRSGPRVDATLDLAPPFEYEKDDVRAEFNTGEPASLGDKALDLPRTTTWSPPQPANAASDLQADLNPTPDTFSNDDPLRSVQDAHHRRFAEDPTPTRPTSEMSLEEADRASEPRKNAAREAPESDGEADEAGTEDDEEGS